MDSPVSYPQHRVWLIDRIHPGLPTFNVPQGLWLGGQVDVTALEWALTSVVARHEALRTTFPQVCDEPVQRIGDPWPVAIAAADLRGLPEAQREAEALRRATELAREPLAVETGPLMRAMLVTVDDRRHLLVLVLHHIVCDGWSMGRLVTELGRSYTARVRGTTPDLPHLPVQYRDFASWQRRTVAERLDGDLTFWRGYLAGADLALDLPTDRPRPPAQRFGGALHRFSLPAGVANGIRQLAAATTATPYLVALTGFAATLARYSGRPDLLVGTPIANRTRPEFEYLIGYFGNLVTLRVDLTGNPNFATAVSRTRACAAGVYDHQDLPFEILLDNLDTRRDPGRHPIFQSLLVFQNFMPADAPFADLDVTYLEMDNGTAKADLYATLGWLGDGIGGSVQYDRDLFDPESVAGLADDFGALLAGGVLNPGTPVSHLPLAAPATVAPVPPSPAYGPFRPVHEQVIAQARLAPWRIVAARGSVQLTYAQLDDMSKAVAATVTAAGVSAGGTVGVSVRPGPYGLAALLGVLRAGAVYLPLDPAYPVPRLAHMLRDSQVAVLVADADAPDGLRDSVETVVDLDRLSPSANAAASVPVEPDDLAYVVYTSGSTGTPKGVEITHGALVNLLAGMRATLGVERSCVVLSTSSWSFDMAVPELFLAPVTGGSVVFAPRDAVSDGTRMLRLLTDTGATILQATPSAWRMLLDAGLSPGSLRVAVCGAEPMTADVARDLPAVVGAVWNLYGPTEATVWSTAHRVRAGDRPAVIGVPLPGTGARVLSADLQPVPRGAVGELFLTGAGVARGYRRMPALTAQKFLPDPERLGARMYRTGDLVRVRRDGAIEFAGRADDQVKVRGYRVEPGEVEHAVLACGTVRQVAVVAADEAGGRRLAGYVVPAAPAAFDAAHLRRYLRERLPDYLVPTIVVLDELPRLANGKIDRRSLATRPVQAPATGTPFVPPDGPREEVLARIWGEVLGLPAVGRHDNFFALGGDSIRALRVVNRANVAGFPLEPTDVFIHQTVAALAAAAPAGPPPPAFTPAAGAVPEAELAKLRRMLAAKGERGDR